MLRLSFKKSNQIIYIDLKKPIFPVLYPEILTESILITLGETENASFVDEPH